MHECLSSKDLARDLPATEEPGNREPRIGNDSSPHSSFSVLGFPVSRLPSPKVVRTARKIGSSGVLGECKNLTVLIRGLRLIPEGYQKIAGGRSGAETTGKLETKRCIPQGCQNSSMMICGKHSLVAGIPPGCDPHSAPFRWSPLRCDHRLLSFIPSG